VSDVDREAIRKGKEDVERLYGAWTAHNIRLDSDLFTRANRLYGDEYKLRRVVQLIADIAGSDFGSLRVLDLGCLEGLYSIELAKRGADVVGIEGREANIAKARFAKKALGLDNVDFAQDDVRNLRRETYGEFDVILCLGLLYHLDADDVFALLGRIGELSRRMAIVDTHVALSGRESRSHGGELYRGISFPEYAEEDSLWAAIGNRTSFWPTRASLVNALARAGFTSVSDLLAPAQPLEQPDRVLLLAIKGEPQVPVSTVTQEMAQGVPERRRRRFVLQQARWFPLAKRLAMRFKR
jgi:SAM-dependent methyltransferase